MSASFRSFAYLFASLPAFAQSAAQTVTVPLTADAWEGTDSVRVESYLGRQSLYINRGVALARGVTLENGTIEYDIAASSRTSFLGLSFRAVSPMFSEVLLVRPRQSGTSQALQYAPAFNNVAAAWQVYHGPESEAVAIIERERWIHVRVELDGPTARIYFDTATVPSLSVSHLAGSGGNRFGVWTGAYGRGAYFSNIKFTPSAGSVMTAGTPTPEPGVITHWDLSNVVEPEAFTPASLPPLDKLHWRPVTAEPEGFVLVNRWYVQPNGGLPVKAGTNEVLVDSVMTGKIASSKVVYARTTIESPRAELRRMQFSYSDGVVIYLNGRPLALAMNPQGLRDGLGMMAKFGDAVYLPLKQGRNELVFAVIELTGGWAFGAKLDR